MILEFSQREDYDLAVGILAQPSLGLSYSPSVNSLSIDMADHRIGRLLSRIGTTDAVVLPVAADQIDQWFVIGVDRYATENAFAQIRPFILPAFGALPANTAFATYQAFQTGHVPIIASISSSYRGYTVWHSPQLYRAQVVEKILMWMDAAYHRPLLTIERLPTYADLYGQFQSAMAAHQWQIAESVLDELRRLRLTSVENVAYLHVVWLSAQQRWEDIWYNPQLRTLTKQAVPRVVRAALLTAFHSVELLALEYSDDIRAALARFRVAQAQLGVLLESRVDITEGPVIRVFGYHAAASGDRRAMNELHALSSLDAATQACLDALTLLLPREISPRLSAEIRFREALAEHDYDGALKATLEITDPPERCYVILQLATRRRDQETARLAMGVFEALSPHERAALEAIDDPFLYQYIERVRELRASDDLRLETWTEWFAVLLASPQDERLSRSLDPIGEQQQNYTWDREELEKLVLQLNQLVDDDALRGQKRTRRAVEMLADGFLNDAQFPRAEEWYADVYETLLFWLMMDKNVNEQSSKKAISLSDVLLRREPHRSDQIGRDFTDWFSTPRPVLETAALDSFEMLVDYGARPELLVDWYRTWVNYLLDLPNEWELVAQEVWMSLGVWIQPGDDLLTRLQRSIEAKKSKSVENLFAQLSQGFKIAIFTLDHASADRARSLILSRNPNIVMEGYYETDVNRRMEAAARNADAVIIVADCITHAVTYGISPILKQLGKQPIYPASRGSTSIVRAMEDYLKTM